MLLEEVVSINLFYHTIIVIGGVLFIVYLGLKFGNKINNFFYHLGKK